MQEKEYIKMLELHNKHWWYLGRKEIIRYLIKKYHKNAGRILDVGCGPGYFFDEFDGIGIDKIFKGSNIINGEIEEINIEEKFDVILCLDVLEHLENDEILKKYLDKNLKQDGIAIITVPAHQNLFSEHDVINGHYRRYEIKQMKEYFKNYKILKLAYFNSLLYPIEYIYRKLTKGKENFKMPNKILNKILYEIFRIEKYMIGYMPNGLSIIAIIKK